MNQDLIGWIFNRALNHPIVIQSTPIGGLVLDQEVGSEKGEWGGGCGRKGEGERGERGYIYRYIVAIIDKGRR